MGRSLPEESSRLQWQRPQEGERDRGACGVVTPVLWGKLKEELGALCKPEGGKRARTDGVIDSEPRTCSGENPFCF